MNYYSGYYECFCCSALFVSDSDSVDTIDDGSEYDGQPLCKECAEHDSSELFCCSNCDDGDDDDDDDDDYDELVDDGEGVIRE